MSMPGLMGLFGGERKGKVKISKKQEGPSSRVFGVFLFPGSKI
jgi:hypothetical protein